MSRRPGWSTDYVTVRVASDFKIKEVVLIGKPDYVYTSDFTKNKKAKPLKELNWKEYMNIIPSKWKPGMHAPVDPVASRLAKSKGIKVVVAGKDLNNLRNILSGKKFKGTVIS